MSFRVQIEPEFFTWAIKRSCKDSKKLQKRFKNLSKWINGSVSPTFKQLEKFAKATYVPIGYFFLKKPPKEDIPIPDFRTIKNVEITRPSPNLLDTIYLCQQKQGWYREFIQSVGGGKNKFVGACNIQDSVKTTAEKMRKHLRFDIKKRKDLRTWKEALKLFIDNIDSIGITVIFSGTLGNNTHRKLDINEFRGFAICDDLAPLIFINSQSSKSAQMFTLAHELAHIWLGKSALSNSDLSSFPSNKIEIWCNKVAAEFLVPLEEIRKKNMDKKPFKLVVKNLCNNYKVSSLVIIRRLLDAKRISKEEFNRAYNEEIKKFASLSPQTSGGNFYKNMALKHGKRFMQDLVSSTWEGNTSFTEALYLLGINKVSTLEKIGKDLGIM